MKEDRQKSQTSLNTPLIYRFGTGIVKLIYIFGKKKKKEPAKEPYPVLSNHAADKTIGTRILKLTLSCISQ